MGPLTISLNSDMTLMRLSRRRIVFIAIDLISWNAVQRQKDRIQKTFPLKEWSRMFAYYVRVLFVWFFFGVFFWGGRRKINIIMLFL